MTAIDDLAWAAREARMHRKFGNKKVRVGGYVFDSKREYERWTDLNLLQEAGDISELKRQVAYVLAPAVRMGPTKRLKPALKLVVDFQYRDEHTGKLVLEDTKGVMTAAFRIKQHLLMDRYGMEVRVLK